MHATLKPRGVLFSSNPRGHNEEGWTGGRYGAYHDLETWRRFMLAADFLELDPLLPPCRPAARTATLARERVAEVVEVIESLLLAVTRVTTMFGPQPLTNATGFFFERDGRLYLVTSRHVVLDEASNHHPDRLEIELHVDPGNVAMTRQFSIPLYRDGKSIWREGRDSAGPIDVVALELERAGAAGDAALPRVHARPPGEAAPPDRSGHLGAHRRISRSAFTTPCTACRSRGRRSSPRRSASGSRGTATS